MPQWGSQDYKRAVFDQLAQGGDAGSSGSAGDEGGSSGSYDHFDNFSQGAPRPDVEHGVGEVFHPERMSPDQATAELNKAAGQINPEQRAEVAQDLLDKLHLKGLTPTWLQKMLGLQTTDPSQVGPADLGKLAEYARQNHPEVFQQVVADKPWLVRWMSHPVVAAMVGIIAGKLLNRAYK